ncbi:MAG: hypothetical protein CMJ63_02755, partial [Planctomycetaceae bacterium]|nr:hypothetical protein [Planctomycetaceae bacterium]
MIVTTAMFRQTSPTSVKNGHQLNHSYSVISNKRLSRSGYQAPGSQNARLTGTPAEPIEQYTNSTAIKKMPNQMLFSRPSGPGRNRFDDTCAMNR